MHLSGARLNADERRLATEIIYGVVRRQATLDALIKPHAKRQRHRIERGLWTLLEIGVYQLAFTTSVPPHAALHETVEVTKRLGKRRWSGFLNGVLRSVAADLTDEKTDHPAADAIPLAPGHYRRCRQPVFADPEADPVGYVTQAFSFPAWLIRRWGQRYDFHELERLGFWFNTPANIWLRVNLLKTTRAAVLDALAEHGIEARPGDCPEAIALEESRPVERLPGFDAGWFSVQDESAMHASRLLGPQPGWTVLDLCAAPGGKTAHLAELMANQGHILAADINRERLARIVSATRRLGLDIVEPVLIRPDQSDLPPGPFDAILVDAPCSNTGVLGRRPEVRWRIKPADIEELAALGRRLLLSATQRLKRGGRIVYSTCSLEPEENSHVVRSVLAERTGLRLIAEKQHLPGRPADGGYQALCLENDSSMPVD